MYQLRTLDNFKEALSIYRNVTQLRDRADNHYEMRAQQRGPESSFLCYAIEQASLKNEVIGLLEYGKHPLLNSEWDAEMGLFIREEFWDDSSLDKLLEETLQRLRSQNFRTLHINTDHIRLRDYLYLHHFELNLESVESVRDLEELRETPYPKLDAPLRILTFREILKSQKEEAYEFVFPLIKTVFYDIPGSREMALQLTPSLIQRSWQGSHFLPDASFFLLKDEELIGVHNLVSLAPQELRAGVTGILPTHRRKGYMRTLKKHGLIWGAKNHYLRFVSNNEINNPMLDLNLQLGFTEIRRTYEFKKEL